MADRTTRVILHNNTAFSLTKIENDLDHGEWQDPWFPPQEIFANTVAEWRSESGGDIPLIGSVLTGTEGHVKYKIEDGHNSSLFIHWDNPFLKDNFTFSGINNYHEFVSNGFEIFHDVGGTENENDATVSFTLAISEPHWVKGFCPSNSGFQFPNSWPDVADRHIHIGPVDIPIGSASNGLCGGMIYASRDYSEISELPPQGSANPPATDDNPLFHYIVSRLFDSFDIKDITMYLKLMDPIYPDTDENVTSPIIGTELGMRGRAWLTIKEEWPLIKNDIDAGHPSTIGLIQVKSLLPTDIGENHQVLYIWI